MKKRIIAITMMLTMMFSAVTANATETPVPEKEDFSLDIFQERFDEKVASMDDNFGSRIENRTGLHNEKVAEAEERFQLRLSVIETYAPDMVDDFVNTFDAHLAVHELLFNELITAHTDYYEETITNLNELKDEVFAEILAGNMTPKEARAAMGEYLKTRREEYKALREAYQAEIAPLNEDNEANKEIANGLKAELKAAIELNDTETIESILSELLVLSKLHIDYDYAKLAILETY